MHRSKKFLFSFLLIVSFGTAFADIKISGTVNTEFIATQSQERDFNKDFKRYSSAMGLMYAFSHDLKHHFGLKEILLSVDQDYLRGFPLDMDEEPETVFNISLSKNIGEVLTTVSHRKTSQPSYEIEYNEIEFEYDPVFLPSFYVQYGKKSHSLFGLDDVMRASSQNREAGIRKDFGNNWTFAYSVLSRKGNESVFEMFRDGIGHEDYTIPIGIGDFVSENYKLNQNSLAIDFEDHDLQGNFKISKVKQDFGCLMLLRFCLRDIKNEMLVKEAQFSHRISNKVSVGFNRLWSSYIQDNEYSIGTNLNDELSANMTYSSSENRLYFGFNALLN